MFRDRTQAGQELAAVLKQKELKAAVVLGIPRGGVPVAAEVAKAIGAEIAVVVARKLGAPHMPELAIGATTATGVSYINTGVALAAGADVAYIAAETEKQVKEAQRREELFDGHRRPDVKGRTVIVVDDGVATGATAIAAVRSIKAEGAEKVILAVPVGPPEMVELLRCEADEVVCLDQDPGFWSVGQCYEDFRQVGDDEVLEILQAFAAPVPADPSRQVDISRGPIHLAGVLTTPAGAGPFPLVIFVHGLGSSKDSPRNVVIANRLVDEGIATLLFDLSGHGDSSHDPGGGMAAYVADAEAAFVWARSQPGVRADAIGISGSSLGATVAAIAEGEGRIEPATLVLRAPPMDEDQFRALHVPALVLIGSHDPLFYDVQRGVEGCSELSLSVVAGASHLFEEPGTLEEALDRTVAWFKARLLQPVAGAR